MPRWKATLSYDGTHLHGWQVQPELPTVQGTLAGALARVTGEHTLPQGSGRTDAGVHALGQVAHFDLMSRIPGANLHRALNRILPATVRILDLTKVEPHFHARHSARSKTYEYRIFTRRPLHSVDLQSSHELPDQICSPMMAPFVWDCPLSLDRDRLERAAGAILGMHDFSSFAAAGSDALNPDRLPYRPAHSLSNYSAAPPTPCRTILSSTWHHDSDLLTYRITGTGFLHHMVRNLVGTFVLIGAGRLEPEDVARILAAQSRSAAGPTAPARGLFLMEVQY